MRRRRLSVVLALVCLATPVPSMPARAGDPAGPAWGACPPPLPGAVRHPAQECTVLPVPVDYADPDSGLMEIAVSRIATAKPATRRGILLFNPGGPGGSGLDFPGQLTAVLPAEVTERFDLVGFDPRGTGHSTPITCGPTPTVPDLLIPYPGPDGSIDRNVAYSRQIAADCARLSGPALRHVTSANTARDMDRIRAALGEPRLSYLGYSYGTYLGTVYASLFPDRVDRMLLDGAVDPRLVWYGMRRGWSVAVAVRFPDFAAWAADRHGTYRFGTTPGAVTRVYHELTARLDRKPVAVGNRIVDGNTLRETTRLALYSDAGFPALAAFWTTVIQSPSATPVAAADPVEAVPVAGDGAWSTAQPPADNRRAMIYAIGCGDVAWPRDIGLYAAAVAADRAAFPLTAGMPANIWPCAFWPYGPAEPPVRVVDDGPRTILVLQNLRDPGSPSTAALGLRAALGRRARLVTVDQGGQGAYLVGGAPCANDIGTAFLSRGDLPARDTRCPGAGASTAAAGDPRSGGAGGDR